MSEEKPRLSRREMREQGLLKTGGEETPALRDDLQTRTSELQLRRPSRREMRLQREANEAKVAEQSAKFNTPSSTAESQPEKSPESRSVYSFNLSGGTPSTPSELAQRFSVPTDAGKSPLDNDKEVKPEHNLPASAPTVSDSEVTKDEKPAASTGRSSVFDRFTSKDDRAVSFRDRLVARTREGQREARENQLTLSDLPVDLPEKQTEGVAQWFGARSDEGKKETVPQVEDTTVKENKAVTDDKVEAVPVPVLEPRTEIKPEPVVEPNPAPMTVPTPEDTAGSDTDIEDAREDTSANTTDKVEEKTTLEKTTTINPINVKESVEDSSTVVAVANDGRYPTDVSMRLTDDDEEKTGGDRLISLLIILVGVLIGVVVGLIAQNFIFGAQSIDMNPDYSVQAAASSYTIGS